MVQKYLETKRTTQLTKNMAQYMKRSKVMYARFLDRLSGKGEHEDEKSKATYVNRYARKAKKNVITKAANKPSRIQQVTTIMT
jgi:hypothetical protein